MHLGLRTNLTNIYTTVIQMVALSVQESSDRSYKCIESKLFIGNSGETTWIIQKYKRNIIENINSTGI